MVETNGKALVRSYTFIFMKTYDFRLAIVKGLTLKALIKSSPRIECGKNNSTLSNFDIKMIILINDGDSQFKGF
jgi:hypothetical protein